MFDGDCFNTNFFEMLWVMVIVYVSKLILEEFVVIESLLRIT